MLQHESKLCHLITAEYFLMQLQSYIKSAMSFISAELGVQTDTRLNYVGDSNIRQITIAYDLSCIYCLGFISHYYSRVYLLQCCNMISSLHCDISTFGHSSVTVRLWAPCFSRTWPICRQSLVTVLS